MCRKKSLNIAHYELNCGYYMALNGHRCSWSYTCVVNILKPDQVHVLQIYLTFPKPCADKEQFKTLKTEKNIKSENSERKF